MLTILYIVIMTLFLFGITVFVHEWGHFIVAKKCGLKIEAFSIGMGPALWKKEVDGIVYKIGAFPIGGYVSLPQLDPAGMERIQGDNDEAERDTLPEITPAKKIAVAVAGPLANVLFALPLAALAMLAEPMPEHSIVGGVAEESKAYEQGLRSGDKIIAANGNPMTGWYEIMSEDVLSSGAGSIELTYVRGTETNNIVLPSKSTLPSEGTMAPAMTLLLAQITAKDPAHIAGIKTGDTITHVDGQEITWWHELADIIQDYDGVETTVTVLRGKKSVTMNITPRYTTKYEMNKVIIGVRPGDPGLLPWTMEGGPIQQIKDDGSKIFRLIQALSTKSESKEAAKALGGPIAIFTIITFALKLGIFYAIGFIRFININLAVLNLLPLPVLDGGHICFALWEMITKRKVHPKVVATLVNVFAILLLSAMVFLSWRDVDRNWNVSRFFKKEAPVEQVEKAPEEMPAEPQLDE